MGGGGGGLFDAPPKKRPLDTTAFKKDKTLFQLFVDLSGKSELMVKISRLGPGRVLCSTDIWVMVP